MIDIAPGQKNGASTLSYIVWGGGPIGRYRGCGGSLRQAHLTPQAGRTDDETKALPFRPSVRPAKGVFLEKHGRRKEERQIPAR